MTAAHPASTAAVTLAVGTAIQSNPQLSPLVLPYVAVVLIIALHGGRRFLFPFDRRGRR